MAEGVESCFDSEFLEYLVLVETAAGCVLSFAEILLEDFFGEMIEARDFGSELFETEDKLDFVGEYLVGDVDLSLFLSTFRSSPNTYFGVSGKVFCQLFFGTTDRRNIYIYIIRVRQRIRLMHFIIYTRFAVCLF